MKPIQTLFFFFCLYSFATNAQSISTECELSPKVSANASSLNYCSARLNNDELVLENSCISRSYLWNNGNLITRKLTDKKNRKIWISNAKLPDMSFPGQLQLPTDVSFTAAVIAETAVKPEHLEATIICTLGALEIKRIFRIYPDCPAIACDVYLRGRAEKEWTPQISNPGDLQNI